MAGKGDTPRPVDGEKFRENYEAIFLKKENMRLRAALTDIAGMDTSQDASPQQCEAVAVAMDALRL